VRIHIFPYEVAFNHKLRRGHGPMSCAALVGNDCNAHLKVFLLYRYPDLRFWLLATNFYGKLEQFGLFV
jgi:hypothetical protein